MLPENEQPQRKAQQETRPQHKSSSEKIRSTRRKRVRKTLLISIAIFVIIFLGFRVSLQYYVADGASMEPTIHDQQMIWVNKLAYLFSPPRRGDIIVYTLSTSSANDCDLSSQELSLTRFGRLVGIPGDTILNADTAVIVNGKTSYPFPAGTINFAAGSSSMPGVNVKLGANQYYILGDNILQSMDSRCFGPISRNDIIGQVL